MPSSLTAEPAATGRHRRRSGARGRQVDDPSRKRARQRGTACWTLSSTRTRHFSRSGCRVALAATCGACRAAAAGCPAWKQAHCDSPRTWTKPPELTAAAPAPLAQVAPRRLQSRAHPVDSAPARHPLHRRCPRSLARRPSRPRRARRHRSRLRSRREGRRMSEPAVPAHITTVQQLAEHAEARDLDWCWLLTLREPCPT